MRRMKRRVTYDICKLEDLPNLCLARILLFLSPTLPRLRVEETVAWQTLLCAELVLEAQRCWICLGIVPAPDTLQGRWCPPCNKCQRRRCFNCMIRYRCSGVVRRIPILREVRCGIYCPCWNGFDHAKCRHVKRVGYPLVCAVRLFENDTFCTICGICINSNSDDGPYCPLHAKFHVDWKRCDHCYSLGVYGPIRDPALMWK